MAMLLAVTIGIREEQVLACMFVLMATTMIFGFLTEVSPRR
jgi:hypothetical protein